MALTKGFKKFIALVAVTAVVGGGIYYMKVVHKAEPESAVDAGVAPASTPTPMPQEQPQQETSTAQAPAPTVQHSDPSADRGMNFLLKQGKE